MGFEMVEGFSRPDWGTIRRFIDANISAGDFDIAWNCVAERWLEQLSQDMGRECRVGRSQNFLCLSDLEEKTTQSVLSYSESVVGVIRETLREAAWTGYHGKHVLLLFADQDDYFAYISYYYGDGSHALSGGVFLGDGYCHIALPYANALTAEHALVHELVHNLLFHLAIPAWLNEGLAMVIERRVLRQPFPVDQDLVERHAGFWNEKNIQFFWAGTSFDEPGDSNELSYSLAEIFVVLLSEKAGDFIPFILSADWHDAGQDAALKCLGLDLGEFAAGFLGPGNWRPQRKAISNLLQNGK
jgi:hypothetical protein